MSRLDDKFCPVIKKDCLIDGCAHYDDRLDNCAWNLLPYNAYKVAIAIEQAFSGMPLSTPSQPIYPRKKR